MFFAFELSFLVLNHKSRKMAEHFHIWCVTLCVILAVSISTSGREKLRNENLIFYFNRSLMISRASWAVTPPTLLWTLLNFSHDSTNTINELLRKREKVESVTARQIELDIIRLLMKFDRIIWESTLICAIWIWCEREEVAKTRRSERISFPFVDVETFFSSFSFASQQYHSNRWEKVLQP